MTSETNQLLAEIVRELGDLNRGVSELLGLVDHKSEIKEVYTLVEQIHGLIQSDRYGAFGPSEELLATYMFSVDVE